MSTTTTVSAEELLNTIAATRRQVLKDAAATMAESPVEDGPTKAAIVLKNGEQLFSAVFGFVPPVRGDFAVPVRTPADWPSWAHAYIPSKNEQHIWSQKETEMVVSAMIRGKRSGLIHGPKGCGKSQLGEQVCAYLCIPFFRVNLSEDAEGSRVFGAPNVIEGSLDWTKGMAEMAAEIGGVLCVDEVSAAPPGINLNMQWMLEKNGKILLENKPEQAGERLIVPKSGFFVLCTDNTQLQGDTTGKYGGTQVQNEAFIDRMQFVIAMGYMDPAKEIEMIKGYYKKLRKETATKMVTLATQIRNLYDNKKVGLTISPRGLLEWAEEAVDTGSIPEAFRYTIYDKFMDADKTQVNDLFMRVFGVPL